MAPPGNKLVVHSKPHQRQTWGFHGEDGFYVGPSLEHYRCIQCLMSESRCIKISDTVQIFPHAITFPKTILTDCLHTAINEIISTLANSKFKHDNPSLTYDDETMLAIQVIANMLHRLAHKPPLPPPQQIKPPVHPTPPLSLPFKPSPPVPTPTILSPLPRVMR